jgi:hypothetical protein
MSVIIKEGSYCPICKCITLCDCKHYAWEFGNTYIDKFDVAVRTLESIHGDCEMMLKRIYHENISRKESAKILRNIYEKCNSIKHIR